MKKLLPSHEELRKLLRYEPETGKLFWLHRPNARKEWNTRHAGKEAFTAKSGRYRHGSVNNVLFYAHRVIWAIETGAWPTDEIDHINGNGLDNTWQNLRKATRFQNMKNLKKPSTNTSGYKGVSKHTEVNKWIARIRSDGKLMCLGNFETKEEAYAAYCKASAKLHGQFSNFG